MHTRLLTVISVGLLAAACQNPAQPPSPYAASAPPPPPPAYSGNYTSSEQVCTEYGFNAGTAGFDRCVSRERQVRASGRVNRDYSQMRLSEDARTACSSYGLQPGTGRYDQCVNREVEARRYQPNQPVQPSAAYRTDQYGNRIDAQGYRVDANGNRLPRQS